MEPLRTIRLTSCERLPEEAGDHEPWEPQRQRCWQHRRQRRRRRRRVKRSKWRVHGAEVERVEGEEDEDDEEEEAEEGEEGEDEEVGEQAGFPAMPPEIIAMNNDQRELTSSGSGGRRNSELRRLWLTVLISVLVGVAASGQLTSAPDCDQTRRTHAHVWHPENRSPRLAAGRIGGPAPPLHRPQLQRRSVALGDGDPSGARRPDSSKVMALATKLDHWLQCHRTNLLAAYGRHVGGDDKPDQRQQQQPGQTQTPASEPGRNETSSAAVATCAAHFDGHLCWPEARAGQEVRLECPQINSLYTPGADLTGSALGQALTNHLESPNQQIEPLKTVITSSNIQRDINRTQETSPPAGPQSIRPIGNRATSINQSEAISQLARGDGSAPVDSGPILESGPRQARFARRRCEPHLRAKETPAKWQPAADYADCGGGGHLFDPTDRWLELGDYTDLDEDAKRQPPDDDAHDDGGPDEGRGEDHNRRRTPDRELFESLAQQLERIDPRIDPYSEALDQWIYCIGQIIEERERRPARGQSGGSRPDSSANSSSTSAGGRAGAGECPIIFDGWRCWPATEAGGTAYLNCPMRPGFSTKRKAFKICTPQADWARHPDSNRYWSNYTTCVDTVDLAFRTKIININVIGYLMSLVALAVSLMIFVVFKNLRCTRVTIHKNLFVSFIVNNSMWIVWNTYIISKPQVLESNPLGCRLWHVLVHYFLMSNYFWMFCEGLYLHTLLVVTFIKEDKILKWFYLLGWLTPIPIIVAYAYERSSDENYAKFCWIDQSPHDVIFQAPIVTSLVLNLIFLVNIVRVLVMKLRANNAQDTHQTRKAARATLILIPLLGLNYILTPFRPEPESEWHVYYEVVAAVCTSLQGLCVAVLFCFYNGEVTSTIKKRLKDSFLFNRDNKRTMRSRSNTAMSNILNSGPNTELAAAAAAARNSLCAPELRPPASAAVSSSSWSSSAVSSRQPLASNHCKPNGRQSGASTSPGPNQEADQHLPLLPPPPQAGRPLTVVVLETKLTTAAKQQQQQQQRPLPTSDDEAVKLLAPSENNNNNSNDDIDDIDNTTASGQATTRQGPADWPHAG